MEVAQQASSKGSSWRWCGEEVVEGMVGAGERWSESDVAPFGTVSK